MGTVQLIDNIVRNGTKLSYVKPLITSRNHYKLPQFLYHFTSEECADKIIKQGKLIAQEEGSDLKVAGVFMLDLENFIKNWPKLKMNLEHSSINFFNALFPQVTKGGERLACFRIPTKCLNKRTVIRDQSNVIEASQRISNMEDASSLITKVDDARLYEIYHQKGHAIEFIHEGDIEVQKDNLVGIVNLPEELKTYVIGANPCKSAFDTLKYLFIKQPETKILEKI